jgi:hypothetical protein
MGNYSNTAVTLEFPSDRTKEIVQPKPRKSRGQHVGAFVIQFQTGNTGNVELFEGRVEHVASGQLVHFYSRKELLAFLDRMRAETAAPNTDRCVVTATLKRTRQFYKAEMPSK